MQLPLPLMQMLLLLLPKQQPGAAQVLMCGGQWAGSAVLGACSA
jgi:hypothetical protein